MKLPSTVLLCSFFILIFLSCQQKQGNLTSVNHEGVYIFGVWKAPTAKTAKEVVHSVSTRIRTRHLSHTVGQKEETQQIDGELEAVSEIVTNSTTAAPETLLPKDGEITDWVRSHKPRTYNSETLYHDRIVLSETYSQKFRNYGFQKKAEVEYQSPKFGSIPYILFEIFDMGTPENAFGIFSVHSYPHPQFEWIGCDAIISGKYLWFWKGKYFIQIEGYAIATGIREGAIDLAKVTAKKIQDPPQKIPLLKLLPVPYIRGSEKLFPTNSMLREVDKSLPNIIPELMDGTIGVLARYNIRSKKPTPPYTVFVIRFPTVADAESAHTQYRNALISENVTFKTDPQNGAILIDEQFDEP